MRHWPTHLFLPCVLACQSGTADFKTGEVETPPEVPTVDSDVIEPPAPMPVAVTIRARYMRPNETAWDGLDYINTTTQPIRRAEIWVQDADTEELLATGVTDDEGQFIVSAMSDQRLRAGVAAHIPDLALQVLDNTSEDALYTLISDKQLTDDASEDSWVMNAFVEHDGISYIDRTSGPFAILDTALGVAEQLANDRDVDFSPLNIFWSPRNVPVRGDKSEGDIRTSHWSDDVGIFLLGAEDVDTDEYDTTVIAHEWMHYYENTIARSDSYGGSHSSSAYLHMSVALSEGAATGLGCATLGDSRYRDSDDPGQLDSWEHDIEDNTVGDAVGWYASRSASSLVWDLYDTDADEQDNIALSVGQLHDIWTGPLVETPAMTSLFALGHAVRVMHPDLSDAVDALWIREQIVAPMDPWGTGETNDGGDPEAISPAVFRPIVLDEAQRAEPFGPASDAENRIGDYRYYRFTADADQTIIIETSADDDVDLRVFHRGTRLCSSRGYDGDESCEVSVAEGEDYVIELDGTHLSETIGVDLSVGVMP